MDKFLTDDLKNKVIGIVKAYKFHYKDEFDAFVAQQKARVAHNKDKFASTGGDNVIEREIYVIPQTLDIITQKILSQEEYMAFKDNLPEFKDKPASKPMSRWFAKTFPEFRAGELV